MYTATRSRQKSRIYAAGRGVYLATYLNHISPSCLASYLAHASPNISPHVSPTSRPHLASYLAPHIGLISRLMSRLISRPHLASYLAHTSPHISPISRPHVASYLGLISCLTSRLYLAPHIGPYLGFISLASCLPSYLARILPHISPTRRRISRPHLAHISPHISPRTCQGGTERSSAESVNSYKDYGYIHVLLFLVACLPLGMAASQILTVELLLPEPISPTYTPSLFEPTRRALSGVTIGIGCMRLHTAIYGFTPGDIPRNPECRRRSLGLPFRGHVSGSTYVFAVHAGRHTTGAPTSRSRFSHISRISRAYLASYFASHPAHISFVSQKG